LTKLFLFKQENRVRKKSKYKPRPVLVDPVGFVVESVKPLAEHDDYVLKWKLKNHEAFASLMRGQAGKDDINTLAAARNISEALLVVLDGSDVDGTLARSAVAIIELCDRGNAGKSLVMRSEEMQAMRDLMQLHDELLDVVTIRQFEDALAYAKKEIAAGRASTLKEVAHG
jgi:hypothetical protein